MWHLGTEFSGGHGSAGLRVGLHDLRGLLQALILQFRAGALCTAPGTAGIGRGWTDSINMDTAGTVLS